MSLYITSLNSGSNGNCYYIGNNKEAVLIDAGISCREIEKRMSRLSLSLNKVKAIFVSHEHTDHIKGIPILAKKYGIPVYITPATLHNCNFSLEKVCAFMPEKQVEIGQLLIKAFLKTHDAAHPHSFMVEYAGIKVGVFTDLGKVCDELTKHFKQCNAAFLEANYCEELLDKGNYPYFLKNRIRGGRGHLSNTEALNLLKAHRPDNLSHLILSHLSKNNNCPDLVRELFLENAGETKIIVASRLQETEVYEISHTLKEKVMMPVYEQASLFE
jgi:phosphoribosyl 1,2-cyclic phosphodiesterase